MFESKSNDLANDSEGKSKFSEAYRSCRRWVFPFSFVCFAWYLLFITTYAASSLSYQSSRQNLGFEDGSSVRGYSKSIIFSNCIPRLIRFGMMKDGDDLLPENNTLGYKLTAPGFEFELAPVPSKRSISFELGAIWAELGGREMKNDNDHQSAAETPPLLPTSDDNQKKLLSEAASLLNRPTEFIKSVDQLTMILKTLRDEEGGVKASVAQRVNGIFSVINVIWLIAIIGIFVSIGPTIYYLLKPLRDFLKRSWKFLFDYIIEPGIRICHNWGIIELSLWLFSAWICLDAHQYYGTDARRYIGITGVCFSILAFLYTNGRNIESCYYTAAFSRAPVARQTNKWFHAVSWRYCIAACLPFSIVFDSSFLGFIATGAAFGQLGFGGFSGPFCYAIGFDDQHALVRCAFASSILLSTMIGLRVFEFPIVARLTPLQIPISIFGSLVLHIALLIVSSKYYAKRGWFSSSSQSIPSYLFRNAMMIFVLLLEMGVGSTYPELEGLANSASVFMVLYLWSKSGEFCDEAKLSPWIFILVSSLCLWKSSLYMHANPGIITSAFY